MADEAERPTVEGFAPSNGLSWRGHLTDTLHSRGIVNGIQGLPPDSDHLFVYQVGFQTLGPPTHAEAIVFLWSDQATMDDLTLRQESVRLMAQMVERGA